MRNEIAGRFGLGKMTLVATAVLPISAFGAATVANGQEVAAVGNDWSGFYVGSQIGGATGTSRKDFSQGTTTGDYTVNGVIGGGTGGFNTEWGRLVAGIEGDISASGVNGGANCPNRAFTCETNTDWLLTLRPRLGYVITNVMPYVTAGLATGNVNVHSFLKTTGGGGVDYTRTQLGWTAGAGLETSIGSNWSFKGEYLHVSLADTNVPSNIGTATNVKFDENIFRIGVNYRFE